MKIISYIVLAALLLLVAWLPPAVAGRAGVIVYEVIDIEVSARVVTNTGTNLICLITPEGHGFTKNHKKWTGFTCAKLGVEPLTWQFCRGKRDKLQLLCVTPETEINGVVESADPGNDPTIRMITIQLDSLGRAIENN